MQGTALYPRYLGRHLLEALEDSPVVLVHGPRQCGKTTFAQSVCAPDHTTDALRHPETSYWYISFDDDVVRAGAQSDPMGFVADLPERVILDEVQRVPEIFSALKLAVDRRRTPGRFLLTGSTNVLLVPTLAESLAGRMQIVQLHPLSQVELTAGLGTWPANIEPGQGFLDVLFGDGFKMGRNDRMGVELAERIVAGGYPAALTRPTERRIAAWYRDYVEALVQRDVQDLARIRELDVMPRLLAAAASQTARLFNLADLAAPFQLTRPTIQDYVALLERVFLLGRLPAWSNNRLSRLVHAPKLHLCDTGLICALLGVDSKALYTDRTLMGQVMETFVFQELQRQSGWSETPTKFSHYRDRDQVEVDIVLERGVSAVAGVEVKAGATVKPGDFRGLRKLRKIAGDRFTNGVVIYDGEMTVSFGDRLYAVPARHLWEHSRLPGGTAPTAVR